MVLAVNFKKQLHLFLCHVGVKHVFQQPLQYSFKTVAVEQAFDFVTVVSVADDVVVSARTCKQQFDIVVKMYLYLCTAQVTFAEVFRYLSATQEVMLEVAGQSQYSNFLVCQFALYRNADSAFEVGVKLVAFRHVKGKCAVCKYNVVICSVNS